MAALIGTVASSGCAPGSETAQATTQTSSAATGQGEIAARIGDRTITLAEVDSKALAANMNVYQALHSARTAALDEIVAEILIEREADAQGISVEELTEREIDEKLEPVTDAHIEEFYSQNRARIPNELGEVREQIRTFLETTRQSETRQAFIDELRSKVAVETSLQAPRVEIQVASAEPMKGDAEAKVTIVEYSDFQ